VRSHSSVIWSKHGSWFLFAVLLLYACVNALSQPDGPRQEVNTGGASRPAAIADGEAGRISAGDFFRFVSEAESAEDDQASGKQAKRFPICKPRAFERDGLYLWRDATGTWFLHVAGSEERTVTGSIAVGGSLSVIDTAAGALVGKENGKAALRWHGQAGSAGTFRASSSDIHLSIRINGRAEPARVFVGRRMRSPNSADFMLQAASLSPSPAERKERNTQEHFAEKEMAAGTPPPSGVQSPAGTGAGRGARRLHK